MCLAKMLNRLRICGPNEWFLVPRNRRSARPRSTSTRTNIAAEVLELRQMLTINVTAAVTTNPAGRSRILTLTDDNMGDTVNIYRLNSTQIEIDGSSQTTINGMPSDLIRLTSLDGIVVHLGAGYDTYKVQSKAGDPALNIGKQGLLFGGRSRHCGIR